MLEMEVYKFRKQQADAATILVLSTFLISCSVCH
jgi:hypothetical protein